MSNMLARCEHLLRRLEVAIVGRGDADEIDVRCRQLFDGLGAREVLKVGNLLSGRLLIGSRTLSRSGSDRCQFDVEGAAPSVPQPFRMRAFKERAVRFIEDHPEADHARSQD